MNPQKAKAILAKRRALSFNPEKLFDPTFPKQTEFVKDPHKQKTLFCTRRAAKSYTAGLYMVYEALSVPDSNCMFIGLTRGTAKRIIWKDILRKINKQHNLGAKFNGTELSMTFPNGSVIYITGADADEEEMNKLLGAKYRLVCIDEASMYSIDMEQMVYGVLAPAMTDPVKKGESGTICLMGTASDYPRGLFHGITTGVEPGWKLFTWTAHDNPHVAKEWQEGLDIIKRDRPLYMKTNRFKQWYLNEWAVDEDKLVYKFSNLRNTYDKQPQLFPEDDWTYVLGVDTGWEDDNAFVLTGYHPKDKNLYIIKTFNKNHMVFETGDPSKPGIVEKIREFMADTRYPISKVVIDGANKQGVESMKSRALIPFEYAEKHDKVTFIEIMNGDFVQEKIKIQHDLKNLIKELSELVWKTNGGKIVYPKKEDPALPNHMCDALLYAWRCGFHYAYQAAPKEPEPFSPEWYKREQTNMEDRAYEQARIEATQNVSDPFYTNENQPDLSKWRKG